jgi:peptide/nickel transport system permease protein
MRADYVARRFGVFLLIIWLAATVNFFLPRLSSQDPVRAALVAQMAAGGSGQAGLREMVAEYDAKFGLDKPLWEQYLTYMADAVRFDFNYSISSYPQKVVDMIATALPWTMILLAFCTVMSWVVGTLLGALMGWPKAPRYLQFLLPPLLSLNGIPYFLLGLILIYLLGFKAQLFPLSGGYAQGTIPSLTLPFIRDVIYHSVLPALSIILVSVGGWALGMRAMMVTTRGEDYMVFADAKGLRDRSVFVRYGLRNALLPQTTALALALGQLVSGAVLVEVIFSYPGIGSLLFQAIRGSDFYLVQGIVFIIILSIGVATFILDLIYPLLDPRITYRRA